MTNILEKLKNGKCLCLKCGEVNEAGWTVCDNSPRSPFTSCYNNCSYNDGSSVAVITWNDLQYGEPTPDGLSQANHDWLKAFYPEIIAEMDRVETMQGEAIEALAMRKQHALLEAAE